MSIVIHRSSVSSTDSISKNGDGQNEVIDCVNFTDKLNETDMILTFLKTYIPKKTKTSNIEVSNYAKKTSCALE